uniref:uncharacterized protein LOC104266153 isoform X2 n=1 Tax=Ciona intestinalis TaxID=7719 RepID=UPI0005219C2B|nr:uncharacterized protein LOC104266153 isoform X2 [Ciona intestinalis]|eukprot:XP_009860038.1 uncharacterized protein LOC104266153 isoform X2 [Ciona intestinalis]
METQNSNHVFLHSIQILPIQLKIMYLINGQFSFGTKFGKVNETLSKMYYRRHNANVMQNAPKDQLLVFNIKDGWDPLCKFLDQPVPGTPFPHKNKKASLTADIMNTDSIMLKMQRETTLFYCTTLMLGTVSAAMWYYYK